MAQHDYTIANQTFPLTRQDINDLAAAVVTNNSGASEPTLMYNYQWWFDTNTNTLKFRNADNDAWISFATFDMVNDTVNLVDSAVDIVTDLSPQLGANLDLNSNDITGTGNINITGNITASGNLAGTLTTASQPNITSVGTLTSFTSTGIDDNATSTAITIDSSENVFIKTTGTGTNIGIDNVSTGYYLRDGGQFRVARDNSQSIIANRLNGDGAIIDLRRDGDTVGQLSAQSGGMGFNVGSSASEAMRIDSSGNVGIGTSSPNQKLEIFTDGSSSANPVINLRMNQGNSANGDNQAITFDFKPYSYSYYNRTASIGYVTENDWTSLSSSGWDGRLTFNVSTITNIGSADTLPTERMCINEVGNVGIGTSSPSSPLHIKTTGSSGTETEVLRLETTGTNDGSGITIDMRTSHINTQIAMVDGSGSYDGNIVFRTAGGSLLATPTEKIRIDSSGRVGINNSSPSSLLNIDSNSSLSGDAQLSYFEDAENRSGNYRQNTNASFTNIMTLMYTARTGGSTFDFLRMASNAATDNEFRFRGDGEALADGSFTGGGADYAEYFEWSDGNIDNENRVGYSVVLDNNKIRKATDTDNVSEIIGVISANPVVVGDASWNKWTNKHLRDDFGSYIWEEHNVVEWVGQELVEEAQDEVYDEEGNVVEEAKEAVYKEKKHSYEDWNIPEGIIVPDDAEIKTHDDKGNHFKHRKVNPDYNPNIEYIPREERKEWDTVGLMGKLRIRKGQPIGDRWIKMRDISDTVEEWLIR